MNDDVMFLILPNHLNHNYKLRLYANIEVDRYYKVNYEEY